MTMKLRKIYLLLSVLSVLFYSCSSDDDPMPVGPCPGRDFTPITLTYQDRYEITDFKVYVGSPEGGRDISSEYSSPEEIWGERLTKYNHPDTILFRSEDSISHLPHRVSVDDYAYEWRKDSLFAYNPYAEAWELYGFGNMISFEYAMSFHKMVLIDEYIYRASMGQSHGVTNSKDYFYPNSVASIPEMTNVRDTIAWCNVRYYYK